MKRMNVFTTRQCDRALTRAGTDHERRSDAGEGEGAPGRETAVQRVRHREGKHLPVAAVRADLGPVASSLQK